MSRSRTHISLILIVYIEVKNTVFTLVAVDLICQYIVQYMYMYIVYNKNFNETIISSRNRANKGIQPCELM